MKYSQSVVARQYAKAYILEYGGILLLADIENMKSVINFCRHKHNFMSLVSLLTARQMKRHELIDDIFEYFSLPEELKLLVDVLIRHKKLALFAYVLQDICCLFFKMHNMLEVTIKTAIVLDGEEQKKFEQFFIKLSGKKIISNVVIDETLIAGVRMQSDVCLWEYSVQSRIRALLQQVNVRKKIQ